MANQTIKRGDTSPIWTTYHRAEDGSMQNLSTGYTCHMKVGDVIDRAVTGLDAASENFLAFLTPAETAQLVEHRAYTVTIQIDNPSLTPPFSNEESIGIHVLPGNIAAM